MIQNVENTAAYVHQRLLNKARKSTHPFNKLLQNFAILTFSLIIRCD